MPEFDTYTDENTGEDTQHNAEGILETDESPDADEYSDDSDEDTSSGDDTGSGEDAIHESAPRARGRGKKGITRNQVVKILTKRDELADTDQTVLDVLATSIGAKATPADITAVLYSTGRVNLSPIADLLTITDASSESPYQGMLKAMQVDREQAKLIWQTLGAIGAVTGNAPAKDSAMSVAIAEAAAELDDEHVAWFDRVRELARK